MTLLVIGIIGAGTYLLRLSFIGTLGGRRVPDALERPLRFIAPSILAAIVLPALVRPEGPIDLSVDNLRLVAGAVAGVVAWRTKNVVLTTVTGLSALWILEALF
ncbi:MAG TPA: AzlD domain-containing protein [Acidimicrobiia bacterium]|nr:AzlD domain-containing protein [Acidimicrobiia bacterium]